jgi:hypothetical protein
MGQAKIAARSMHRYMTGENAPGTPEPIPTQKEESVKRAG